MFTHNKKQASKLTKSICHMQFKNGHCSCEGISNVSLELFRQIELFHSVVTKNSNLSQFYGYCISTKEMNKSHK